MHSLDFIHHCIAVIYNLQSSSLPTTNHLALSSLSSISNGLLLFRFVSNFNLILFYFLFQFSCALFISCLILLSQSCFFLHRPIMEHVFIGEAMSNTIFKMNCALQARFMKAIESTEFHVQFNICKLHVRSYLKRFMSLRAVSSIKIVDVISAEESASSKSLGLNIFAGIPDPNLQVICTYQFWQMLWTFRPGATYAENEPRVRKFSSILFRAKCRSVTPVNGSQFLQTILNTARRGFVATLNIKIQSVFALHMFFYSIATEKKGTQAMTLKWSCA